MTDNFQVNWRSRIVKSGKILASQLTPHPNNPKYHPPSQREAIATSIDTYGQIGRVIININNGYLVDGHERGWLAVAQTKDVEVEADWVDITEQEHLQLLALYDHIGHMAGYEPELLDTLLQQVNSDSEVIQRMLSELAEGVGIVPPNVDFREYDESVADEVEYCECPNCGHKFPK